MSSLTQLESAVAPFCAAALFLAAKKLGESFGLPQPSVEQILTVTGASKSRAYELAAELSSWLPRLTRPVGRPAADRAETPPTSPGEAISRAVLRYVMAHPGSVSGSTRQRYSDGFRHFVVALREAHPDVEVSDFATHAEVPLGTLKAWLAAITAPPAAETAPAKIAPAVEPSATTGLASVTAAQIETVLLAYASWHGDFVGFCAHVKSELRIPWGRSVISDVLSVHGARRPLRRAGRNPDELALRGAFETFFPGAQWVGDGKSVAVRVGTELVSFNLELMVDAESGAFTGMSIRPTEDSEAVALAFADGVVTTGAPPIATLLDNKPCNHTPEVDAALGDTLRIRATKNRPQNKAHVEGAFGLFSQTVPPLALEWPTSAAHLGEQLLRLVATTWARATNQRPRSDRNGRSRVDLYGQPPSKEQLNAAHRALEERMAKQERARATSEARQRPEVRALLDDAFERLALCDPERYVRLAIARYPIDAIATGIAIFESKRIARTLPDDADARYLLGIVKHVAAERELTILADLLLQRRIEARDASLDALAAKRDLIRNSGTTDDALIAHHVDRALLADRAIDRTFWLDVLADFITSARTADSRTARYRLAALRIATTYRAEPRARQSALCALAERFAPLSDPAASL